MTTALIKHEGGIQHAQSAPVVDESRKDLLKRTICNGANDAELELFVAVCNRMGLDPFARQISAVFRYDKDAGRKVMTIQTNIDGYRLVAERSGKYDGQEGPHWCGDDGEWREVWLDEKNPPKAARVMVYKKDVSRPLVGVARWSSYAQTFKDGNPMAMWAKMPDVMLAKCAEALALRKAFPNDLHGVYTSEEMQQVDSEAPVAADSFDAPEAEVIAESAPLDKLHACETFAEMEALKPELAKLTGDERAEALRVYKERAAEFEAKGAA